MDAGLGGLGGLIRSAGRYFVTGATGALCAIIVGWSEPGRADETLLGTGIETHGFVSQGFILTTRNNYLAKSKDGSFEFSEVGINFTRPLSQDLRLGLQLFARDLGPIGNYGVNADWYYIDYSPSPVLGLRVGRLKLPFGLYNEVNDIDAARATVLLPQSIYPTQNRDFLLAQTGLELYGNLPLSGLGNVEYRMYAGTILLEVDPNPLSPYVVTELTIPYVAGGRVLWDVQGLRVGGSLQALDLDATLLQEDTQIDIDLDALMWVASAEYTLSELVLTAEYSRWHVDTTSSVPDRFPSNSTTSERAYAMASWRLNDWFQPSA